MNKEIRILMLEDDPNDAQLVARELRVGGISFSLHRVDSKQFFTYELRNHTPDVILSDHGLPAFDGMSALAMTKLKCPQVPFIFVTGKHGEEAVVDALKKGATDYILKDRLNRLVPAVRRALRDADETHKKKKEVLRQMADFCPDALFATASA
jgi:DNA-binding NtrC family response regulator